MRMLSLFTGCGGMDIGFHGGFTTRRAFLPADPSGMVCDGLGEGWVRVAPTRFRTVFANDIRLAAKIVYMQNCTDKDFQERCYRTESVLDLVRAHLRGDSVFPDNIDLVIGGFPCQDFSTAGKRMGLASAVSHRGEPIADSCPAEERRGGLFQWYRRVVEIVKPKAFVAENVGGMLSLQEAYDTIRESFATIGAGAYRLLPPRVLQAADFGVPQSRCRLFFIGVRTDALSAAAARAFALPEPDPRFSLFPAVSHCPAARVRMGFMPYASCAQALEGLGEPTEPCDPSHRFFSRAKFRGGGQQGEREIDWYGIAPTVRSEHHGNIEFRRLAAHHGGARTEELAAGLPERRLSVREAALLQTFPPDMQFVIPRVDPATGRERFLVSASEAYRLIGNAVPPILAYRIAHRLDAIWDDMFNV